MSTSVVTNAPASRVTVSADEIQVIISQLTGPQGAAGVGVPAGGTINQILAKASADDYDTHWVTGGAGGVESDPIFVAHVAYGITSTLISQWNTAYGWGNHAGLYLALDQTTPQTVANGQPNFSAGIDTDVLDFDLTPATGADAIGRLRWNVDDSTLNLGLKSTVVLQIGQEELAYVYNDESTALSDGEVVYISGIQGNRLAVKRAQATSWAAINVAHALVTEPIASHEYGFVCCGGMVRNLDTSALSEGPAYLSATTPGALTSTPPVYARCICQVLTVSNGNGVIYVPRKRPEADPIYMAQAAVTLSPTGFGNRALTTLSFTDSSPDRTLTIAPTGANFTVYSGGVPYTKTSTTKQITNTAGLWYVYFDTSGTIQASTDAWDIGTANIPIALVYWNGTSHRLLDERHGAARWPILHEYLHETRGAAYASGGALTAAADGSTFVVASGEWYDEDYEHTPAQATTAPLIYRAGGVWTWTAAQAPYFHAVASVPKYDNAGTLTDVDANKYSQTWVFWTNDVDNQVQLLVGQGQYNTQALAEAVDPSSLTLPPWLGAESKLLYRIVWQRNGAVITRKSITDYRRAAGQSSSYIANDHTALANLGWATSGHTGTASNLAAFGADSSAAYVAVGTTAGTVAAGDHNHSGVYEVSGAVATHAALTTGVHGLAITAGQTLTVTTGGTIGSAAYTASTDYATAGHNHSGVYEAAGAVATHAALTTGVHGLAITAGQTLTVTTGGTLGSAAYTASTDYATAGHNHSGVYLPAATKLDDLSAPDDNTDLNATVSAHGLLPKLGGGTTNYLRADGTWAAPAGGAHDALTLAATLTDVFSLSSQELQADDAGADKIVFWDDSGAKLTYGTVADVGAAAAVHTHSYLANLVEDTSPQLGGDLDANGNSIHFGTAENTQTPAGTAATIDLGAENHHTLNCGSASGAITLTLTVPPGPCAGTIIVVQGATARDITWSPSSGAAIWLGTEPTWTGDTNKTRIVAWRWNATDLYLSATETN